MNFRAGKDTSQVDVIVQCFFWLVTKTWHGSGWNHWFNRSLSERNISTYIRISKTELDYRSTLSHPYLPPPTFNAYSYNGNSIPKLFHRHLGGEEDMSARMIPKHWIWLSQCDFLFELKLPLSVKAVPYASGLEHADTKLVGTMKDLQLHCWLPQRLESSKHQSSGVYKLVGGSVSNSKTTNLISWSSSFLLVVVSKYHSTTHREFHHPFEGIRWYSI